MGLLKLLYIIMIKQVDQTYTVYLYDHHFHCGSQQCSMDMLAINPTEKSRGAWYANHVLIPKPFMVLNAREKNLTEPAQFCDVEIVYLPLFHLPVSDFAMHTYLPTQLMIIIVIIPFDDLQPVLIKVQSSRIQ